MDPLPANLVFPATFSTDVELVAGCRRRDEAAIREFVARFQGVLFAICLRILGQREDAEDVVQETLVRALRRLDQWDSGRPLRPWVSAIAWNRARTLLSKRPRETGGCNLDQLAACRPAPGTGELREELELACRRLRGEYQVVLHLFHGREWEIEEIARALQRPHGTIKVWLHRARTELASILTRRGFEAAGAAGREQ